MINDQILNQLPPYIQALQNNITKSILINDIIRLENLINLATLLNLFRK